MYVLIKEKKKWTGIGRIEISITDVRQVHPFFLLASYVWITRVKIRSLLCGAVSALFFFSGKFEIIRLLIFYVVESSMNCIMVTQHCCMYVVRCLYTYVSTKMNTRWWFSIVIYETLEENRHLFGVTETSVFYTMTNYLRHCWRFFDRIRST